MIADDQIANAHILIIDDQKLHSLFLEKILKEEGYRHVQCVNDPLKVMTAVRSFHPDVIVLDLDMPQLDGFQIMSQLSEFRRGHDLPIMALGEDKSAADRIRALQSGATDFLNTPYENAEILFRLRNMIEVRLLHWQVENQNKLLETKVQDRTRELRDSQFEVIHRLAQAAEFRDKQTGQHIIRMSQYCAKLGEAWGLDDGQCDLLLNASPLHDVGKIGIPDSILLKPGRLTPEEYEIMKTHTTIGAQLLAGSNSALMKMAETIALTHHEKWDGTGYPKKLKGDEIPLLGQICSVCDVFDALTSERPYKKAWTMDESVKELIRQKDLQFAAPIVDRFMDILPEVRAIKKKFSE